MKLIQGKKILFLTGPSGRDQLLYEVAKEMKNRFLIEDYYLSDIPRNRVFLEDNGVSKDKIRDFPRFYTDIKKPDISYLRECEERYNLRIWDMWELVRFRNRKYSKFSREHILCLFEYAFRQAEKIIDGLRFDYMVANAVASYHHLLFFKIAKKKGVEIIEFNETRISNHFAIKDNLIQEFPLLRYNYNKIKKRKLSDREREETLYFIKNFMGGPKRSRFLLSRFAFFSRYLRLEKIKRIVKGAIADKKLPLGFVGFNTRVKLKELFFRKIGVFEIPPEGEKFILYPLHYEPEIATLLYGKWYANQINLIQLLSKSIPVDHMLYVKEHPFSYGNRKLSFYKTTKSLPNVRIISPHADTFDLIKRSSLIATITSTVGFEALFFRKPVITFGHVFYNLFDEVEKVERIAGLPDIIKRKIDEGLINEDNLLKFMLAVRRSLHEGLAIYPEMCDGLSIRRDNIAKLVSGIDEYIKSMKI